MAKTQPIKKPNKKSNKPSGIRSSVLRSDPLETAEQKIQQALQSGTNAHVGATQCVAPTPTKGG